MIFMSTAIAETFRRIDHKFNLMYSKRDFMYEPIRYYCCHCSAEVAAEPWFQLRVAMTRLADGKVPQALTSRMS